MGGVSTALCGIFPFFLKAQADQQGRLLWGDITVDSTHAHRMLRVHLRESKCDQFGKGVNIFVGKTDNEQCPVTTVVADMARPDGRPILPPAREEPLGEANIAELRSALTAIGMDPLLYEGHSFHIGAATVASQAGLPDSTIPGPQAMEQCSIHVVHPDARYLASVTARILQPTSTELNSLCLSQEPMVPSHWAVTTPTQYTSHAAGGGACHTPPSMLAKGG